MANVTLPQFQQFAREIAPAARAVLMARVFAEMERERVDGYIKPLFATYRFFPDRKWTEEHGAKPGDVDHFETQITDQKNLYLTDLEDPYYLSYLDDCDRAHRAHGFTGKPWYCPALIAEHLVIEAENLLIELAEPLFGVKLSQLYGENREKYLELLIGAGIKAEKEAA